MSYIFVHGKHVLTQELADAFGLNGKPIRSLSIRMCVNELVSVVVEFVPQEAEVQALVETLKHYWLAEKVVAPSILEPDENPLDDLGHQRRTRPVMLSDGQHDGQVARIIVGGKADRAQQAKTKEGQIYVATDRRHGTMCGLQIWECSGEIEPEAPNTFVERPLRFADVFRAPIERTNDYALKGGPFDGQKREIPVGVTFLEEGGHCYSTHGASYVGVMNYMEPVPPPTERTTVELPADAKAQRIMEKIEANRAMEGETPINFREWT